MSCVKLAEVVLEITMRWAQRLIELRAGEVTFERIQACRNQAIQEIAVTLLHWPQDMFRRTG